MAIDQQVQVRDEDLPQPCAGIRVIDLTKGMTGPMATMVLADHGADVTKIEPPDGDWARARLRGFHMWNRGKRSICLDLTISSDRDRLASLIATADVVVTESANAVSGIDRDFVRISNPRAVHCNLSAWGGVFDECRAVYEPTLAAATGQLVGLDLLSGRILHPTRSDPTFSISPTASYGAAMLAVQAILAALLAQGDGDPGDFIETSLLHGSMAFLMRQELARPVPERSDAKADLVQRGIELSFLTAECADGRYIQMCARQDHHFRSWLRVLGVEHVLAEDRFASAPLRIASFADADELEELLRERMRAKTQAEWMAIFVQEQDIGADPFLTPEEFLVHDQMVENHRIVQVDDPVIGASTQVGVLATIDGWAPSSFAPAPTLAARDDRTLDRSNEAPAGAAENPMAPIGGSPASSLPLAGVTILEVAYFVAGPLATTLLAELGARVIKIEPHDGDPYRRTGLQSAKFLHGKESIALDLKHPDGRAVLHDLIAKSDVLVHSFRAGVPQRLGMDEATARAINPDLVYLNAASYGTRGPEASRVAFHSTPTALTGAGIAQAGAGNAPVDDSFPDPAAGLGAATALMIALHQRRRVGHGCGIETTMLTSAAYVVSNDLVMVDGDSRARIADREQLGVSACYRLYPCAQGWVFVAVVSDGEWQRFVESIADPVLTYDARFGTPENRELHDEALAGEIGRIMLAERADHWQDQLTSVGVACAAVDFSGFEAWLERHGVLLPASHPTFGDYYRLPPKSSFAQRPTADLPACAVGEHSRSILGELGRSPAEIDRLIDDGAVRQWADGQ